MIYCMSMFRYGTFATYTDTSLGRITYRPQYAQSFTLTPSIDLYPTILPGQGTGVCSTERIKAGESVTLPAVGGGNTNIYIPASDYIRDIGDLRTLAVDSAAGSMSVAGKRLQRLKLGDPDASTVTSTLTGLTIGACPSLTEIDARNVVGLTETIDLTNCPRIKSAYFGGTDVKSVVVPSGAKIMNLQLSDATTTISLVDLPKLSSEGLIYSDLSNVEYLRIEDCPNLDAFDMLKELYNTESKSLRNIRVTDFVYDGDATDVDMVMNLAKDIAADGSTVDYTGIDSEGTPQQTLIPIIEGTLNIAGSVYADSASFVREQYPNLMLNVAGGYYIRFADKAVKDICVAKWGDGIGITEAQAAAVTSLSTIFRNNTTITEFMELGKFGVTTIEKYGFAGCINLIKADLSKINTINYSSFESCINFAGDGNGDLRLPSLISIGNEAFGGYKVQCVGLRRILDLGSITILPNAADNFSGVFRNQINLTEVHLPETLKTIGSCCFQDCTSLADINFPSSLTKIDNHAFSGCTALESVNLSSALTSISSYAFNGCTSLEIADLSLPNLESIGINAFTGVKITRISNLGKITSLPNIS